jgi:hypothetical protein
MFCVCMCAHGARNTVYRYIYISRRVYWIRCTEAKSNRCRVSRTYFTQCVRSCQLSDFLATAENDTTHIIVRQQKPVRHKDHLSHKNPKPS